MFQIEGYTSPIFKNGRFYFLKGCFVVRMPALTQHTLYQITKSNRPIMSASKGSGGTEQLKVVWLCPTLAASAGSNKDQKEMSKVSGGDETKASIKYINSCSFF